MDQVKGSHVIATGGLTAMLGGAFVYLTHWPLQPLDPGAALNFAGLFVAAGGGLLALYRMYHPVPVTKL